MASEKILGTQYPEVEPYMHSMLQVSDLHSIYFEQCGNPAGYPVSCWDTARVCANVEAETSATCNATSFGSLKACGYHGWLLNVRTHICSTT
jgi:hypothetical protein